MNNSIYKISLIENGKFSFLYPNKFSVFVCAENENEARKIAGNEMGPGSLPKSLLQNNLDIPGNPWRNPECTFCEKVDSPDVDKTCKRFIQ